MTRPVEFLDFVELDLCQAHAFFYDSWQLQGAQKFHARFLEAIAWIEWNSELCPRKYMRFRQATIRKTYNVIGLCT
jgi:hypothetical protein